MSSGNSRFEYYDFKITKFKVPRLSAYITHKNIDNINL